MNLSICFVSFFSFFISFGFVFFGVVFVLRDLVYFIDWGIVMLNGSSVVMTFYLIGCPCCLLVLYLLFLH